MNAILESLSGGEWIEAAWAVMDLLVKGALLCGIAGLATLLMRRSPAYARKAVWAAVLGALIILPISGLFAPAWDIPILPVIGGEMLVSGEIGAPGKGAGSPAQSAPPMAGTPEAPAEAGLFERSRQVGIGWLAFIWLVGLCLCAVWFALSRYLIGRLISKAEPLGGAWQDLLSDLAHKTGVRTRVRLLKSPAITAAMTAGVLRPVIVLPAQAETWARTRRRLVLSHELAHVKRWDSLIEVLGFAATALHWFNPLAWIALNRLRIERERDCDNAVLNSGAKPSDYASLLMEIATDMQRRSKPMWQIATVSEGSSLKDRLLSILDPKINRRNGNLGSMFMIGVLVVAFTIPLSGSRLWKTAVVELAGGDDAKQEEVQKEKKAETCSEEELKKKEMSKAKAAKKAAKLKPMNVREKLESGLKDGETRGTSAAHAIGLKAYDDGAEAADRIFRNLRARSGDEYYFDEKEFNNVGYLLLKVEKVDEAVALFKMNVDMYPESWNVYDSLGEAYLVKGEVARATQLYEQSLEINPDNENGRKMLKMIEKKKKP